MPLTDTQIKALQARGESAQARRREGPFLLVTPSGGKLWRLKYRVDGKEKLLSLGGVPPRCHSRQRALGADDARELIAAGVDPSEARKAEKAVRIAQVEHTFEGNRARSGSRRSACRLDGQPAMPKKVISRLGRMCSPGWARCRWRTSKPMDVLTCCQRIADRGASGYRIPGEAEHRPNLRYARRDGTCRARSDGRSPRSGEETQGGALRGDHQPGRSGGRYCERWTPSRARSLLSRR